MIITRPRLVETIGNNKGTSLVGMNNRLTVLEDTEYEVEIYELINTDTGAVTIPLGATIRLDQYEDAGDCLIVEVDTNNRPIAKRAETAIGDTVLSTFDAGGNYLLSGVPVSYPVALVYQVSIKAKNIGNIPLDNIVQIAEVPNSDKVTNNSLVEGGSVTDALNKLDVLTSGVIDATKEPTGFLDPANCIVTYDSTTRTITLTGNTSSVFKGIPVTSIFDGWTSPAHDAGTGLYFLQYDGTNFSFTNTPFNFRNLLIAIVFRDTANFCLRECHGLMQWQTHHEFHFTLGTYLASGGDLSSFVLSSTTAIDRRPDISSSLIYDEDIPTTLPALNTKLYSRLFLTSTGITNFSLEQSEIISLSGNQPFWNEFTGGTWKQTLFPVNAYGKIFVMAVPVTNDAECQKVRYLFIQPQTVSTNLADIQNITTANINLGHIASALPEYVYIGEIIIRYSSNNWTIISTRKITGTRSTQVSALTGNFLSAVSTDSSLQGTGTATSPLKLSGLIKPVSDSTTAIQITKADGVTPVINVDTINSTTAITGLLTVSDKIVTNNNVELEGNAIGIGRFQTVCNVTNSSAAVFQASTYAGTPTSKTAVIANTPLGYFQSGAYDGSTQSFNRGRIVVISDGNWSPTSTPTRLEFQVTGVNSTSSYAAVSINNQGLLTAVGYTKLGSDAPSIKMKKLSGTTGAVGFQINVPHGLNYTKIIDFSILFHYDAGGGINYGRYSGNSGTSSRVWVYDAYISCINNDADFVGHPFTITIIYEE